MAGTMNESPENADPAVLRTRYSVLARVLRLARKELREILRDRRTLLTLFAMPILLYPLISVLFWQFSLLPSDKSRTRPTYNVDVIGHAETWTCERRYEEGLKAWRRAQGLKPDAPLPRTMPRIVWYPVGANQRDEAIEEQKELMRAGKRDLILVIHDPKAAVFPKNPAMADQWFECQAIAMANSGPARAALAHIEMIFAAANEENLKQRLGAPDVAPRITLLTLEPVFLEAGAPEKAMSLAALVPLILILMTITGAVYPAIDLTAGERERGTLEILVAAPVPRFELLTAKYLSVVTVAVLTALVNLICMTLTLAWSGMGALLFGTEGVSFLLLLAVLGLLLLFAAFFSAVLLCLTSFARSFKEAQAYLIPLMLLSLTPGILAMLPGVELKGVLMVLPLVNIVLMARDLFEGGVDPISGTIVIATTLLYALASLAMAARVFGAESVLYSEQSSWADLLRRPAEPQPTASIPAVLWCLALMVPIQFALVALLQALGPIRPTFGILLQIAVNLLLFGGLPALFVYIGRIEWQSGLGLSAPRPLAAVAGLLLGVSVWPLQLWLIARIGTSGNLEERFGPLVEQMREARAAIGWGVLAIVIVPAILEEIFFRGLLFRALQKSSGALLTIGVSGLLFGLTHVLLGGPLGLDRLVPSTLLGLILGAVCWRTGSLCPSLIQHVCHNAILLIVGLNESGTVHEIPWTWLAGGAIGTAIGTSILLSRNAVGVRGP